MARRMSKCTLAIENQRFAGTGGVSYVNGGRGFVPGFMDLDTGVVYPSRRSDGSPAPIHLMDGLPADVVVARYPSGQVAAIKGSVVAGFIRNETFYTREQVALVLASGGGR